MADCSEAGTKVRLIGCRSIAKRTAASSMPREYGDTLQRGTWRREREPHLRQTAHDRSALTNASLGARIDIFEAIGAHFIDGIPVRRIYGASSRIRAAGIDVLASTSFKMSPIILSLPDRGCKLICPPTYILCQVGVNYLNPSWNRSMKCSCYDLGPWIFWSCHQWNEE